MPPLPHGGRLHQARLRHPHAPTPWIDLSTGISPHPYPFAPPPPEAWSRLPEPEHLAALEAAAAQAYGAPDPAMVVAAPGTQALIQLLPRLFPATDVAIPGPTYAEHAHAWAASGARIHAGGLHPVTVLCSPNNPDGRRHDLDGLPRGVLVVDEAYADFEATPSAATLLPRPGLIVLRSFGKAYGLAGLRLGFALINPADAQRIRDALGPWPVSGPAIAIGHQALTDAAWRTHAAARAHADAARLHRLLTVHALQPVGGTALFHLVATPDAAALSDHLAQAGLLVRTFDHTPSWLRLGLPPDEPAWDRLEKALSRRRERVG